MKRGDPPVHVAGAARVHMAHKHSWLLGKPMVLLTCTCWWVCFDHRQQMLCLISAGDSWWWVDPWARLQLGVCFWPVDWTTPPGAWVIGRAGCSAGRSRVGNPSGRLRLCNRVVREWCIAPCTWCPQVGHTKVLLW